ncbi:hypothetical protein CH238_03565 [[Clostridium] leptum DSM 753]|uniref:Uncharacterized protein n=1 Tax=[Clostridium] leptum DSM 753 TaxID=428125 RepID=A0A855A7A1_9FIRM|nr:hypothetical protein CH238_03565 [[Clostridium] leptum DSM 753]
MLFRRKGSKLKIIQACLTAGGSAALPKESVQGRKNFWAPEERKKKKLRRTRPAQRESALWRSRRKPGKAV